MYWGQGEGGFPGGVVFDGGFASKGGMYIWHDIYIPSDHLAPDAPFTNIRNGISILPGATRIKGMLLNFLIK